MKKIVLAAFAAAVAFPAAAAPGDTATTQGQATAEIVAPIAITHDAGASLNFGVMTAGDGGTVTVTSAGAGSVSSGNVFMVDGTGIAADAFTVTGGANRDFNIATTGGSVTSGANSMSFTTSASAASGTLSGAGTASFTVGGVLTVGASQPAGVYSGSYDATVNYP